MADETLNQAIFWYFIDCSKRCRRLSLKNMKEISKEVSIVSGAVPLQTPVKDFKENEIKNAIQDQLKLITISSDNHFKVKGIHGKFTTIKLLALMYYLTDKLSDGRLTDQGSFEYLKAAKMMILQDLISTYNLPNDPKVSQEKINKCLKSGTTDLFICLFDDLPHNKETRRDADEMQYLYQGLREDSILRKIGDKK